MRVVNRAKLAPKQHPDATLFSHWDTFSVRVFLRDEAQKERKEAISARGPSDFTTRPAGVRLSDSQNASSLSASIKDGVFTFYLRPWTAVACNRSSHASPRRCCKNTYFFKSPKNWDNQNWNDSDLHWWGYRISTGRWRRDKWMPSTQLWKAGMLPAFSCQGWSGFTPPPHCIFRADAGGGSAAELLIYRLHRFHVLPTEEQKLAWMLFNTSDFIYIK